MRTIRLAATLIAALLAWNPVVVAQSATDGSALAREGNSLARSGLYHAALLRYREAAAAGVDTPIFHYNLGVVFYRLGRLDEAVAELTVARLDPALDPLASFNLALAERARGNEPAAASAYQHVVDIGAPRTLRRVAREALAGLAGSSVAVPVDEPLDRRRRRNPQNDSALGLRVSALARYAQDSNVYRAPSEAYVDLSDPASPTITPVVYSATYMPVDLFAGYVLPNEAEDTEFVFGYTMNGDFYDAQFSNANRLSQRFSIGADIDMDAKEGRRRRLDSSFYLRTHDETNFNPDDGLDRTLTGAEVADRLAYSGAGIAADYLHEMGRFLFGFEINYERRQYEDAGTLPNYDHDYFENRGYVDFQINAKTEIGLGIDRLRRVYDERLARDLTGAFSTAADIVEYDYQGIDLSFRRMIGNSIIAEISLSRLDRVDNFAGYYDYTQDVASAALSYQPNPKMRITASASTHQYDFPNAFAFNNPLAGQRELDVSRAEVDFEYALTASLALWVSIETDTSSATDSREQYDRSLAMLGVKWRRD